MRFVPFNTYKTAGKYEAMFVSYPIFSCKGHILHGDTSCGPGVHIKGPYMAAFSTGLYFLAFVGVLTLLFNLLEPASPVW